MITKELQESLLSALAQARKRRHEFLCLEHVLYSFTEQPTTLKLLRACAVDVAKLRQQLEEFLEEKITRLPEGVEHEPEQTLGIQRVLQRAVLHMQSSGKSQIGSGDVLAAMFREGESHAVFLLSSQGVTGLDVMNFISHGIRKDANPDGNRSPWNVQLIRQDAQADNDADGEMAIPVNRNSSQFVRC